MVDPVGPHRRRLHALAYRMLGSVTDADDILQETWLRLSRTDNIENQGAWLTTVVSRLCLDRLRQERNRREEYVGPWLPEPVATEPDEIDRESVSFAFMCLLERLSPTERAVFVLHTVFEEGHAEIATMLGLSHAAVRQLHHRAKQHLAAGQPRFAPTRDEHEALLMRFAAACMTGDAGALGAFLTADASVHTDGGGKAQAAFKVITGADESARFLAGLVKRGRLAGMTVGIRDLNGWPCLVGGVGDVVECVVAIETDGHTIRTVYVVVNPDKLGATLRT